MDEKILNWKYAKNTLFGRHPYFVLLKWVEKDLSYEDNTGYLIVECETDKVFMVAGSNCSCYSWEDEIAGPEDFDRVSSWHMLTQLIPSVIENFKEYAFTVRDDRGLEVNSPDDIKNYVNDWLDWADRNRKEEADDEE